MYTYVWSGNYLTTCFTSVFVSLLRPRLPFGRWTLSEMVNIVLFMLCFLRIAAAGTFSKHFQQHVKLCETCSVYILRLDDVLSPFVSFVGNKSHKNKFVCVSALSGFGLFDAFSGDTFWGTDLLTLPYVYIHTYMYTWWCYHVRIWMVLQKGTLVIMS